MTTTAKPVSMTAVTALILGAAAMLLIPVAVGLHPIAAILAIAAISVGVAAAANTSRRAQSGKWIGYAGAGIGLVAVIIVAGSFIASQ